MSKYSYKNKYSDDETEDDTIYKSYRDKFPSKSLRGLDPLSSLKKSSKSDLDDTDFDNDSNDRVIRIKEFDMNSIPPHDVKDNSGVKKKETYYEVPIRSPFRKNSYSNTKIKSAFRTRRR
jgi:hypothetical protein